MNETIENQVIDEPTPAASGDAQTVETAAPPDESRKANVQLGYEILIEAMIKAGSYPNDAPRQVNLLLDELMNPGEELAAVLGRSPRASDGLRDYVRAINAGLAEGENTRQLFRTSDAWIAYRAISALVDQLESENLQSTPEEIAETSPRAAESETEQAPERDDALPARLQPTGRHETKTLSVRVEGERLEVLAGRLAEATLEKVRVELKKKAIDKAFNLEIKDLEEECERLSNTLIDECEELPVRCEWFLDRTNGVAVLVREDNEEIVQTRLLTAEERNLQLEFDEDGGGAPEPVKLYRALKCNGCGWSWEIPTTDRVPNDAECPQCQGKALSLHGEVFEDEAADDSPEVEEAADRMSAIADDAHATDGPDFEGDADNPGLSTSAATEDEGTAAETAQDAPQEAGEPSPDSESGEEQQTAPEARKRGRPRRVA